MLSEKQSKTGGMARERFTSLEEARKAYERDYVMRTLQELDGNMSRTAEALGLERSHLYRKMKALGINIDS